MINPAGKCLFLFLEQLSSFGVFLTFLAAGFFAVAFFAGFFAAGF